MNNNWGGQLDTVTSLGARVLVNGATDDTTSAFQVLGNSVFTGTALVKGLTNPFVELTATTPGYNAYFQIAGTAANISAGSGMTGISFVINGHTLLFNSSGVISVDGTPGVNCSGSPTSSFSSLGGIVTHC
jgi:hypothetical protein